MAKAEGKKVAKKVAKKVVKTASKKTGKRSVNKSQAIRDYIKANPSAGPTAVCEALGKQGIKVTPPQVSNVKSADARKSGVKPVRRKKAAGKPAGAATDKVSVKALLETSSFVDKVGGVGAAKELLATLEKIGG